MNCAIGTSIYEGSLRENWVKSNSYVLAHTISQRLRKIKNCPPELMPLGLLIGLALSAAFYSGVHELVTDKSLRLSHHSPANHED
ncbi:hypothetical protein N7475_000448 [Penicillium sp. IBT 31633x]|nr:hypothetical protein N7475_000448 [Penicillium sp. IBT 31633x]